MISNIRLHTHNVQKGFILLICQFLIPGYYKLVVLVYIGAFFFLVFFAAVMTFTLGWFTASSQAYSKLH